MGSTFERVEEANATFGAWNFHRAAYQLTARQKQFKQRMDTHDVDIETTNRKPQKTISGIDVKHAILGK